MAQQETAPDSSSSTPQANAEELAGRYIGQWNRLVSTTNWEKGRIICQWREAMMLDGAPVTEYSDEAWAQLVGGVTSQHVGRLRRVSQRFGDVTDQFEGLFWSHFQAALDWDDAEMWLEGSLQNEWSVSQMRGKRWETLGTTAEAQQQEIQQETNEAKVESEAEAQIEVPATEEQKETIEKQVGTEVESASSELPTNIETSNTDPQETDAPDAAPAEKRTRMNVNVESLPDDVAEAFESFKLAIIAHRREGWHETTPESIVDCLDALKQLAMDE